MAITAPHQIFTVCQSDLSSQTQFVFQPTVKATSDNPNVTSVTSNDANVNPSPPWQAWINNGQCEFTVNVPSGANVGDNGTITIAVQGYDANGNVVETGFVEYEVQVINCATQCIPTVIQCQVGDSGTVNPEDINAGQSQFQNTPVDNFGSPSGPVELGPLGIFAGPDAFNYFCRSEGVFNFNVLYPDGSTCPVTINVGAQNSCANLTVDLVVGQSRTILPNQVQNGGAQFWNNNSQIIVQENIPSNHAVIGNVNQNQIIVTALSIGEEIIRVRMQDGEECNVLIRVNETQLVCDNLPQGLSFTCGSGQQQINGVGPIQDTANQFITNAIFTVSQGTIQATHTGGAVYDLVYTPPDNCFGGTAQIKICVPG